MNVRNRFTSATLFASAALIAACSSEPSTPAESTVAAAPAATAAAPGASGARVFFIEPVAGATVKSPVKLRFGIEGLEISPVPPGEVSSARAGTGHHHVGVDTECLPPGTVIPKAAPWVHFGNGTTEIDMQLPPGQHRLALAVGDDMHTTIAGLCSMIDIAVEP